MDEIYVSYFGYKPVIVIHIKDNCLHTCLSYIWKKENTIARDNEYASETYVILILLGFVSCW